MVRFSKKKITKMKIPFSCSKGDHILITDRFNQQYSGTVKSVNKEVGRISLSDLALQPHGVAIEGFRNFDCNDIVEVTKFPRDNHPENFVIDEGKCHEKTWRSKEESEKGINKTLKTKTEFKYIKELSKNFEEAISALMKADKVGLILEDKAKGRLERASVLAVSTDSEIFIFDIQILGDAAFNRGLKSVLENSAIVKIVHDSRLLSDCLLHKHLTNLANVRDLEAEDILMVYEERKMVRKHSRTLEYLIKIYLDLQVESCIVGTHMWHQRPLATSLLEQTAALSSFLIPLQEEIEKRQHQRLISVSNLYNSWIRDSELFDFVKHDPKYTLREQVIELLRPQNTPRTNNFSSLKI